MSSRIVPSSDRQRLAIAVSVAVATWVAAITSWTIHSLEQGGPGDLGLRLQSIGFATVGAVIVASRRGNRIGWIFLVVGWLSASGVLADRYAAHGLEQASMPPATVLAAWYSEWFWLPMLFLALCFGPLVFPTGRLPSRRWRPFFLIMLTCVVATTALSMLDPVLEPSTGGSVDNPIGISPLGDVDDDGVFAALFVPLLFAGAAGGLISVITRFCRSRGTERQQLKWFTYSAFVMITSFVGMGVLDGLFGIRAGIVQIAGMVILPVGTGIAILRYRLFDIDLVVNRTLVYGGLTILLGLAYAGIVALSRAVLPVGSGDLGVAASTLAVAALFNPLRRRVQAGIDQLFYRRKYDAQRTIEEFTARLRDEVDIAVVSRDLLDVVGDTMRPAHVSVWSKARLR